MKKLLSVIFFILIIIAVLVGISYLFDAENLFGAANVLFEDLLNSSTEGTVDSIKLSIENYEF